MNYEYYCSLPWELRAMDLIYPKKSIQVKRCDDIEQQLAEHQIYANVSRHRLFGEKLYIVSFTKDYGGGKHPTDKNIAEALQIPDEWVSLYDCDENKTEYAVKERELNDKHKNCDGRLEWNNPFEFDFNKALGKYNAEDLIQNQIGSGCKRVTTYTDDGLVMLDCCYSSKVVAEDLGISEESVIDVSFDFDGLTHVIIVEDV